MRNSWRSSCVGALTLVLVASVSMSAHRRDEYLQAARLSIDPDRVQLALDLTPGIAVADAVLFEIDLDGDRSISPNEARAYSARLLNALALEVDGIPLFLTPIDDEFPELEAVRNGEGMVRIRAVAAIPALRDGTHHLRYRNSHRPDIGVYLANVLVPASERIIVGAQRRDVDQRELTVEYKLRSDARTRVRDGLLVAIAIAAIWIATLWAPRVWDSRTP